MNQLRVAFKRLRVSVPWTKEEDERLLAILDLQPKFSSAAALLANRTAEECKERWHKIRGIEPTSTGRWKPSESAVLREAVGRLGADWGRIACEVGTRTPRQCKDHYRHCLSSKKGGKWEAWEDQQLHKGVLECGLKWTAISSRFLPSRTPRQCRGRFLQSGIPTIQPAWTPWTAREDVRLLQLVRQHGPRWARIAEQLGWTRSAMGCKARYGTLMGLRRRDHIGIGHATPTVAKIMQALLSDVAKSCENKIHRSPSAMTRSGDQQVPSTRSPAAS